MKAILVAGFAVFLLLCACLPSGFQQQADAQFGDQHFKTTIALIELHKIRYGEYPQSLSDLKYTGEWDLIALQSVSYKRLDNGYKLDIVRGWAGQPELSYPEEFWQGLGIVESNVKRGGEP